jgi:hypothetical protein
MNGTYFRFIPAFCAAVLVALSSPRAQAVDSMPESSAGFVPKLSYPQDAQTVSSAITDTLNALSIPIVSSSTAAIITDYVEGPTTQSAARITHSRYRFSIGLRPALTGGTRVQITVATQASSGADGAPMNWHDVSLFNMGVGHKTSNWLYENVEHTLATGSPVQGLATTGSPSTTRFGSQDSAAGTGAVQTNGFDPHTLSVGGVRLGMTKAEAIAAMQKENPGMLVVHDSYRSANNVQDAGSPFYSNNHTNDTALHWGEDAENAEQARKMGQVFVGFEALDSNIAEDIRARIHLKSKTAWVTDAQGHEAKVFWGDVDYISPYGVHIENDERPNIKDAASIMKSGVGLTCSSPMSNKDNRSLEIAFSPRTGKVIGIGFEQKFCDRDNLPQIASIHDALYRRFPHEVTIDSADPHHIMNVGGRDVAVLWQYDTQGRLVSYEQRQRTLGNAGFGIVGTGMGVVAYARVGSVAAEPRGHTPLSGNPDSLASSTLHIQLTDANGFIQYGEELVAASKAFKDSVQKDDAVNANKKLDANTNRVAF